MYPAHSLSDNLAAFSALLRREHRFLIGPRELQDAARALCVTPLHDERVVRDALRPVLCSNAADAAVFDAAFARFFHSVSGSEQRKPSIPSDVASDEVPDVGQEIVATEHSASVLDVHDEVTERTARVVHASYSPVDAESPAPDLVPANTAWRRSARAFVSELRLRLSRRWRPARHGERFDLRRTLRNSLHTGGEPVVPRWQTRPRRVPRVVMLVDGSRSMGQHAQIALALAVAITDVLPTAETFVFSTFLDRITRQVRRAAAGERVQLEDLHHAWGGGTSIGACLQMFLQQFADRSLNRDTVVIVASDGLDVGAVSLLRDAMARLHRLSAGVIWLNPLLGSEGYEPTAHGMTAARPYVSTLAGLAGPSDLVSVSRTLRVR